MNEEKEIPAFLLKMLQEQYEKKDVDRILKGYHQKRKTSFRVNNLKSSQEEIVKQLQENQIPFETVSWNQDAFVVDSQLENRIRELEVYEEGKIYLQSLSSMLPPIILAPQEGYDILDMAAAPGGKTTQIATLSHNKANITACEMNEIREKRLRYNIEKQGATSVFIMKKDARRLDDFFSFDQILLDSPCSGSGTIKAQDENLEKYFTEKLIQKCTKSQLELLRKAIKVLKPGKEMVYSTCSILKQENEEIVSKILTETKTEIIPIQLNGIEQLPLLPVTIKGTICICPNEYYEGFFIAKIRKIK